MNLKKAKDEIKKSTGNEVDFFSCDTSKFDNVEKVVSKIVEKYKKIDILINNAGKAQAGGVVDAPDEAWKSMIDVKIYSLINTCKTIAPIMKKNNLLLIGNIGKSKGLNGEFFLNSYTSPYDNIISYKDDLIFEKYNL